MDNACSADPSGRRSSRDPTVRIHHALDAFGQVDSWFVADAADPIIAR
jgi:hypothetical protein